MFDMNMDVKKRLFSRDLLKKIGLIQQKLADDVDVPQPAINAYLKGTRLPTLTIAREIADFIGISIEDLMFPAEMRGRQAKRPKKEKRKKKTAQP